MPPSERKLNVLNEGDHPFLLGMPKEFLEVATEHGTEIELEAEEMLFREGEAAERFYLILSGKVALEISAADHPRITVETVGTGEVLGWSWLISPRRWTLDARTVKPTRLIALNAPDLQRYFSQHPELGYRFLLRLLPVIAERLDATRIQLVDIHGA